MAIQVRKKEEAQEQAQAQVENETEVVEAGAPEVNVKLPEMNDKFLMSSGNAMAWLMEHRRMVILVVCLVIVGCLSVIGVMRFQENGRVGRSELLSKAFVTLDAPTQEEAKNLESQRQAALTKQGIAAETSDILKVEYAVPDDAKRFALVQKYMTETANTLDSSEAGSSGRLLLAGVSMQNAKVDEAIKNYETAMAGSPDIRLFAIIGEAEALVESKKYDEAIAKYDQLASIGAGYGSYAKLSQAQIYEMTGKKDEAISAYTSVIRDFGQQDDHQVATARLRMLTPDWQKLIAGDQAAVPGAGDPAPVADSAAPVAPATVAN